MVIILILFTTKKKLLALSAFFIMCVTIPLTLFHFEAKALYDENKLITKEPKYIAIIIDDFGNNSEGTEEMLAMDVPVTAAVMPSMPSSQKDAKDFHENNKGVMLHMPMESKNGKKSWLGPKAITNELSLEETAKNVIESLDELYYAVAINNHMGSKITENRELITEIVKIAKDRELIIVDSVTSNRSVFIEVAQEYGVRCYARDVFLDGTQNISLIEKQLVKTAEIANKKGYAIAIGHVGVEGGRATATAIKEVAPRLKELGYVFVTIDELDSILQLE